MDFTKPLSFTPIYQERVWGGRALAESLGRVLPQEGPVGESWDLVDRDEAQSVVDFGPWKGLTLNQLWLEHREAVFGAGFADGKRFPLLFKILDARELLSVQVHPPASFARALGGEPKTEAWYFLETQPGADVYVGFRNGVTREEFESTLNHGNIEPLLHRIEVSAGEAILVPSGRCHAIGGGCLIAEIQQNSDTTYRVYDWNRVGLDGKPRALHREESLACIDFDDHEPNLAKQNGELVLECPYFRLERWKLEADRSEPSQSGAFFLVAEGVVECGGRVFERGTTFLVPAAAGVIEMGPRGGKAVVLRVSPGR